MTSTARATLRVLRAGSVPDSDIQRLTVGSEALTTAVIDALSTLDSTGHALPLFLNGEWGTGKTHSLRLIRSIALDLGFATMEAVLNARTCPPNFPQRILPVLAGSLAYDNDCGIRSVISSMLKDDGRSTIALTEAWGHGEADIWQAANILHHLSSRGETALLGTTSAWRVLMGSDIANSDYGYRRAKAMRRLNWTTSFLRSLGANGTVLLFDELETIDQLWNRRSRATAYEILGTFLNAPATWCVFGITERFLRVVKEDARSDLFARASPAGQRFLSIWRGDEAEIAAPPLIGETEARALAGIVEGMYCSAYPDTGECGPDCQRMIAEWSRSATRNPRRLVRSIINACDLSRPLTTRFVDGESANA